MTGNVREPGKKERTVKPGACGAHREKAGNVLRVSDI